MNTSVFATRATTLNAKVGAVTFLVAAFMTLLLSHFSEPLAPLRLLALAIAAFAAWAFCDEMDLKAPLNRAGFVFFAIAVGTKVQIILGVENAFIGRYYLLYSIFLLLAVLFWSIAFLHRQKTLKVIGAIGVFASLLPIIIIISGHLVVGLGAFFGITAILSSTNGSALVDLSFVTTIERTFGLWAYVAGWLLWKGQIK